MRDGRFKRVRVLAIVKWASAAMVVVLLITYACSLRWAIGYSRGPWLVQTLPHQVRMLYVKDNGPGFDDGWEWRPHFDAWDGRMWFSWTSRKLGVRGRGGFAYRELRVPLWAPTLVCAGLAVWTSRLDARSRAAARSNACTSCGYSLTGLAPGAACPECGASPPA